MLGLLNVLFTSSVVIVIVILWRKCRPDKRTEFLGNQIPGPKPWPLVGNALSMAKNGQDELNFRIRMRDKYGHFYRHWIGNTVYVCMTDPKDIEVILKDTKEIRKSIVYDFLLNWFGTGLLNSQEQFMEVFNRKSNQLTRDLHLEVNRVLDIMDHVVKTTMYTICETGMGIQTDSITDEIFTYAQTVKKMCHLIADRISRPLMFADFMWRLFGHKKQEDENVKILKKISAKIIKEKEEQILNEGDDDKFVTDVDGNIGIKKKMAFLEMMLRMKLDGSPVFQTHEDIREETETMFFAGHDTVASATCFTLEAIARHPSIQEELHDELKANIHDINQIKASELQNLTLLDRVLKESLRLYPPAPIISRQLYNDVQLPSGYTIPGGSLIAIIIYLVHRHPEHYDNPDEFNPDNFLPEKVNRRHPFAFIPFSAGPRNCIGQKFAMLEFKTIISKIVYNFRVELPDGKSRPLTPYEDIVLRALEGHKFVLRARV